MNSEPKQGPNCWQCRHFAITHQPVTPYACRLMGFRSRALPALQVLQVDGHFCKGYSPKPSLTSTGDTKTRPAAGPVGYSAGA